MTTIYIPVTITVRRGKLALFDADCEVRVDYDTPDGQDLPDWDVTAFLFDGPGELPGQRLAVPVYRHDPLFTVLYENLPHDHITRQLQDLLDE